MIRTTMAVAGAALLALATVEPAPGARHRLFLQDVAANAVLRPGPAAAGGCWVRYAAKTWNSGFVGNVTIHNTGAAAVHGWRLRWAWPSTQQVAGVWNATLNQIGTQVTAQNTSWNAAIAPGGSVTFGFQGTYGRAVGTPTGFALNGTRCGVG